MSLAADGRRAVVVLTSGQTLHISGIDLFPMDRLAEISKLRSQATTKLGGVNSGIGFIGSPGWAIGGALGLGLIEGALSNAVREDGKRLLKDADRQSLQLLQERKTFDVTAIVNHELPHPAIWYADEHTTESVNVDIMSRGTRNEFLARHGRLKSDIVDGHLEIVRVRRFAHNMDEFVTVSTEVGKMHLRWSQVVAYVAPRQQSGNFT